MDRACLVPGREDAILRTIDNQVYKRKFLAERYGGAGISTQGGRCGMDDKYQFKGVGINPLAGLGASLGHSDGVLSLADALFKASWSEILRYTMPQGVVSSLAVLATERYITVERGPHKLLQHRALLVRSPVIRLGYFCRAPNFRPQLNLKIDIPHDALRIQKTIKKLPSIPSLLNNKEENGINFSAQERALSGLLKLSHKLGEQMAMARTCYLVLMEPLNNSLQGR